MAAFPKYFEEEKQNRIEIARKLRELADWMETPTGNIMNASVSLPERVSENVVEYSITIRQFKPN